MDKNIMTPRLIVNQLFFAFERRQTMINNFGVENPHPRLRDEEKHIEWLLGLLAIETQPVFETDWKWLDG